MLKEVFLSKKKQNTFEKKSLLSRDKFFLEKIITVRFPLLLPILSLHLWCMLVWGWQSD